MNNHLHRQLFSRHAGRAGGSSGNCKRNEAGESGRSHIGALGCMQCNSGVCAASGRLRRVDAGVGDNGGVRRSCRDYRANAPSVIQAQNGLPQVNVNRPSAAGGSVNTYNQFDVQKPGAILNNSPVMTGTQKAGVILCNPNYGPGQLRKSTARKILIE